METEPKIEKTETREVMKVPEIEIESEKGLFLLSVLLKGYSSEWGSQDKKCALVKEVEEYFKQNPLDAESVDYLKSIGALEHDGIDEESLFVLSAMYGHPEREPEDLEKYKEIDKARAEELKNGLFGIFDRLDGKLASTKLAKDYERAVKKDIKIREKKLPETRKLIQGVIDFLRPSPETTKLEKISFVPTDLLWRQESGRGNNFGGEFVISENAKIQDTNPHEFMHPIINPITEKLREKITEEQMQKIVKMSPEMLKGKTSYGEHWYSLLNESLIRTYVDYFSRGENPDFESFANRIAKVIKNETDWQEKSKNFDTTTAANMEALGIHSFVDYKRKEKEYFETFQKSELAERVYTFYEKYAEAIQAGPNLNFEDYLQQNYEELVK